MNELPKFSVTDFVAVVNQTLGYAYPRVGVVGEVANFRISRNRWVYFDIKDELSSVRCFMAANQMPGPVEDGMVIEVEAQPRLHPKYNFSLNVDYLRPVGEGSLKRAAELVAAKLKAEGLFDPARKRPIPVFPQKVGLITSAEGAAAKDFIKIMNERWSGVVLQLVDVNVQGAKATSDITAAFAQFNQTPNPPDLIVLTRGGGSTDDLSAFDDENVVRAVAASRIPTVVAVGHEVDTALSEMAADTRASTPSNAAQLIFPDKKNLLDALRQTRKNLSLVLESGLSSAEESAENARQALIDALGTLLSNAEQSLASQNELLEALNPLKVLERGYSIVMKNGQAVKSIKVLRTGDKVTLRLYDGQKDAQISKQ